MGVAQIQLQKGNLPDEYTEAFGMVFAHGDSLLGIINDILDLSKINTGKLELTPAKYDVSSLINDVVQLSIARIGSKRISFSLDVDESLPSKMVGDALRVKQVLNNLLSNAIKFTDEGKVTLSVSYSMEGDEVVLSYVVSDTGRGIAPEALRHVMDDDYTGINAGSVNASDGPGLGLSITRNLVSLMGGSLTAESEPGTGSIFTVVLKQTSAGGAEIGPDVAERLRGFTYTGSKQAEKLQVEREPMPYGSVLVVDDVEINLFVAEGILELYELKVDLAESGQAAIDMVTGGNVYDVIFMDHMMPDLDGIETTKKLRALGYTAPVVALTANALIGNDAMFAEHGFDGFLAKPIDVQNMDVVLQKFVKGRHAGG